MHTKQWSTRTRVAVAGVAAATVFTGVAVFMAPGNSENRGSSPAEASSAPTTTSTSVPKADRPHVDYGVAQAAHRADIDAWNRAVMINAAKEQAEAEHQRAAAEAEVRRIEAQRAEAAEAARATTTTPASAPSTPQATTPKSPAPAPAQAVSGGSTWDALAQCESGGNWAINTGNGYYGGLQFSAQSWRGVGGTGLPHQHSRETQIAMGEKLRAVQGWGAWPACSRKLGLR